MGKRLPVKSSPYYRRALCDVRVAGWDLSEGDYMIAHMIPPKSRRRFAGAEKGTVIKNVELDMRASVLRRYDQAYLPNLVVKSKEHADAAHVPCVLGGPGKVVPHDGYAPVCGWLEEWLDAQGWRGPFGSDLDEPPPVTVVFPEKNRWSESTVARTLYPNVEYVYGRAPEDGLVCHIGKNARVTPGWLSALVRAWGKTGGSHIVPMSNSLIGLSLHPTGGAQRFYGGRSYLDVGHALRTIDPRYPKVEWEDPWCVLEDKDARKDPRVVVADDTYVWMKGAPNVTTPAIWGRATAQHRAVVRACRPRRLPFAFYALNIGPWGGVAALIRVVEEMNETGDVCATVVYSTESDHQFDPPFGPLKMSTTEFKDGFEKAVGWSDGVLCATHWWTPKFVEPVWKRVPGLVPMAYWQDREDWFEDENGVSYIDREVALRYAAVPNRVVNAGWIADESEDLGLHREDFTVVPVGFESDRFYPPRDRVREGPIRILAMWRPMTPRRGAARLSDLYRVLKERFGDKVSLEVFGEAPPRPSPSVLDKHHGWLGHNELSALLREVHLAVEPSDFQGFGLFGVEALASGVPLVSTDNKGIWEYVDKGSLFALVGDIEAHCTNVIKDLLSGKVFDERRIRSSVANLDWRVIGKQWASAARAAYGDGESA